MTCFQQTLVQATCDNTAACDPYASKADDSNCGPRCAETSNGSATPYGKTSKTTYELAMAYRHKKVIVHNIDTHEQKLIDLMQLIPGVPIIGVWIKNGTAKNWCSTPVTRLDSKAQGPLGEADSGEILVMTTTATYLVRPVYAGAKIREADIWDETTFCNLSVAKGRFVLTPAVSELIDLICSDSQRDKTLAQIETQNTADKALTYGASM